MKQTSITELDMTKKLERKRHLRTKHMKQISHDEDSMDWFTQLESRYENLQSLYPLFLSDETIRGKRISGCKQKFKMTKRIRQNEDKSKKQSKQQTYRVSRRSRELNIGNARKVIGKAREKHPDK